MNMVLPFAAFQLIPGFLLSVLFQASAQMLEIGVTALRIISFSFLLAGFGIVCSTTFQALGHGMLGLITSLVRQLVGILPIAWLLSLTGRLEMVWWAFPLAELVSMALSTLFLIYAYKKEIKPLYAAQ